MKSTRESPLNPRKNRDGQESSRRTRPHLIIPVESIFRTEKKRIFYPKVSREGARPVKPRAKNFEKICAVMKFPKNVE